MNTRLVSLIGSYVGQLEPNTVPYLLTFPNLQANTHLSIKFLSPGRTYLEYTEPLTSSPQNLDQYQSYAFFFIPSRKNELKWIQEALPGGSIDTIYDCNTAIVTIYLYNP